MYLNPSTWFNGLDPRCELTLILFRGWRTGDGLVEGVGMNCTYIHTFSFSIDELRGRLPERRPPPERVDRRMKSAITPATSQRSILRVEMTIPQMTTPKSNWAWARAGSLSSGSASC